MRAPELTANLIWICKTLEESIYSLRASGNPYVETENIIFTKIPLGKDILNLCG